MSGIVSYNKFINKFSQAHYQFFGQILSKQKKDLNTIRNFQQELIELFKSGTGPDYKKKINYYFSQQPYDFQESYYQYCNINSWKTKRQQSIKLLDYQQLVNNICKLIGRYVWHKDIALRMLKQDQQVLLKISQLVEDKCLENCRYAKSSTDVLSHTDLEKQIKQKGGGISGYEIQKELKSKYNTTFATPQSSNQDSESDQEDDKESIKQDEKLEENEEEQDDNQSEESQNTNKNNDDEKIDQDTEQDDEREKEDKHQDLNDNDDDENIEDDVSAKQKQDDLDIKKEQQDLGYSSDEQEDEKQDKNNDDTSVSDQEENKKKSTSKKDGPAVPDLQDDLSSDDESIDLYKFKDKNNKQVNTFWE